VSLKINQTKAKSECFPTKYSIGLSDRVERNLSRTLVRCY